MRLQNKVAIVTGGTAGIGRAIAERFLAEGAVVAITGRDRERGERVEASLSDIGTAVFVHADASERMHTDRAIDQVHATFGRLDILVNNVGLPTEIGPVATMSDEVWSTALHTNVTPAFQASRSALRYMLPQGSGRIINMSSVHGKRALPFTAAYTAGKFALNGFTISLAREVGTHGVTVNALCPGLVHTESTQRRFDAAYEQTGLTSAQMVSDFTGGGALQRMTSVEEVAALAVFVASDESAGITGALMSVDGGLGDH